MSTSPGPPAPVTLVTRGTSGIGREVARKVPAMNESLVIAAPASGQRTALPLTGRPALYLLVSLIVSLLAASSAPTPLSGTYQELWHFTPITTTVVFGVYALAV